MLKKRIVLFTIGTAVLLSGFAACGTAGTGSRRRPGTVISSYIRTWAIDEEFRTGSPYWDASMVSAGYLTDINIAFALIDSRDKHTIYIPELMPGRGGEAAFPGLWDETAALKEKYPDLRVNISIGGWGADYFSDMAFNTQLRSLFAAGVCEWLEKYNLDGVDIDWEYPVGPSWGQEIRSRPEDRETYIALLRDLRTEMDKLGRKTRKYYSLSTAVPASSWFLEANDAAAAAEIADALKLMAYDYYGGWSASTGHLSNIYNNPADPAWGGWSTDQALKLYLDAGVPPEKIQMGVAFYGRVFGGVEPGPEGNGLFQQYSSSPNFRGNEEAGYANWSQIKELLKPDSGYTRYWDNTAKAPFLYNGDIWISYCDDEQIKELAAYSKAKGLGGFFSWEYGTDMNAELLKSLADHAR